MQYLNQNKIRLIADEVIETSAFDLHATPISLDEDNVPEWVVQVKAKPFRTTTHLLLQEDSPNNYVLISNKLPSYVGRYHSDGFTSVFTDDLTGDGTNEIIIYNDTYMSGNGNDNSLNIYSWSENELESFPYIGLAYYSLSEDEPTFEVKDFDSDGLKEILVTRRQPGNFDCYLESTHAYIWHEDDWKVSQLSVTDTPECNLWRSGFSSNTVDEDIELLEKALETLEPALTADFDLIALARLRLALAYFVKGEFPEAQRILDSLSDLPEESKFTQLLREAYNDADKEPLQTCRNLIDVADQTLLTDIGNYIINYQAIQGWVEGGYGDLPNRSTICNIAKIAEQIIADTDFPASASPPDVLAQKGVHFDFATAVNLDADPELEWIGILEPQIGKTTTFDLGEEGWVYDIDHLYTLTKNYEVSEQDVTGDGKEDVIALVTEEDYCFDIEKLTLQQSTQLLFTEDESAKFYGSRFPCDSVELLTLEDVGADDFSAYPFNSQPEWKTLENYPQTDLSLYQYGQELQTAVLTQTDPAITTKITDLLNYLPGDDPEAQPYRQHLTYLLGYHYELSGAEEEAVTIYLDLIQQAPSSPWSWLAWARLEPE